MPALPRISWCADKGFLYFDIERKKYTIPVLHCYREFTQNLGQPQRSRAFQYDEKLFLFGCAVILPLMDIGAVIVTKIKVAQPIYKVICAVINAVREYFQQFVPKRILGNLILVIRLAEHGSLHFCRNCML